MVLATVSNTAVRRLIHTVGPASVSLRRMDVLTEICSSGFSPTSNELGCTIGITTSCSAMAPKFDFNKIISI
jgi:hypothetical protein